MAKKFIYSKLPTPLEFRFYQNGAGDNVVCDDCDKIVINGTTSIVNHTLITKDGAPTIFGYDTHSVKDRKYTLEDYDRLVEHPTFQALEKAGSVSRSKSELDTSFNGSTGMLSASELRERNIKDQEGHKLEIN